MENIFERIDDDFHLENSFEVTVALRSYGVFGQHTRRDKSPENSNYHHVESQWF